jgi:DNA-binding transcriptional ArsR family regulator
MMKDGPDLARVASLVGDPARANMLSALLGGMALTASELALEAGVSLPTASSHLAKLSAGGLVTVAVQGRHRYYALSGPRVASMLEAISVVASSDGPQRVRPGPRDAALRHARVCYDHLAGDAGVALYDRLVSGGMLREAIRMEKDGRTLELTPTGESFFRGWGLDPASVPRGRRPLCRSCLDWSVRRSHLAGALGAAVLDRIFELKWARREPGSRVVAFTPPGRRAFEKMLAG